MSQSTQFGSLGAVWVLVVNLRSGASSSPLDSAPVTAQHQAAERLLRSPRNPLSFPPTSITTHICKIGTVHQSSQEKEVQVKQDQSARITKETLMGSKSFLVPAHSPQAAFGIRQVHTASIGSNPFHTDVQKGKKNLPEWQFVI